MQVEPRSIVDRWVQIELEHFWKAERKTQSFHDSQSGTLVPPRSEVGPMTVGLSQTPRRQGISMGQTMASLSCLVFQIRVVHDNVPCWLISFTSTRTNKQISRGVLRAVICLTVFSHLHRPSRLVARLQTDPAETAEGGKPCLPLSVGGWLTLVSGLDAWMRRESGVYASTAAAANVLSYTEGPRFLDPRWKQTNLRGQKDRKKPLGPAAIFCHVFYSYFALRASGGGVVLVAWHRPLTGRRGSFSSLEASGFWRGWSDSPGSHVAFVQAVAVSSLQPLRQPPSFGPNGRSIVASCMWATSTAVCSTPAKTQKTAAKYTQSLGEDIQVRCPGAGT